MKKSNTVKVLSLLAASSLLLAACGSKDNENGSNAAGNNASNNAATGNTAASEETVELVWHYPQPQAQAGLAEVQDAVNAITKAKINATVKLEPYDFGDYEQKMNTAVAGGENFDIAWTSNWSFNYVQNTQKGAFLALDDLLAKYGPDLQASMPSFVWDATKVGGKIYGVPNYQTVTNRAGFSIQQRYLDKYPFDMTTLKKYEDIAPYLETLKKAEPKEYPLLVGKDGMFNSILHTVGLEQVDAGIGTGIGIRSGDPSKIISLFATDEYKNYVNTMRDWFQKGYIKPDVVSLKNINELQSQGKFPVTFGSSMPPGVETSIKNSNGGFDVKTAMISEPYVGTGSIITTMNAINKSSKHPEKAMEFINLLNTDKDLFNTISFGVEGKHYTKVNDTTVKINDAGGYAPNTGWVFGNTFNGYLLDGQSQEVFDATKKENESATPSPLMGFSLDTQPITTEIANVKAVRDEYEPLLVTGSVDPSKKLDEFIGKLDKAGLPKIIAEVQKQLDAWNASK